VASSWAPAIPNVEPRPELKGHPSHFSFVIKIIIFDNLFYSRKQQTNVQKFLKNLL